MQGLDLLTWVTLYIPTAVIYAYSLWSIMFARKQLKQGLDETQEMRATVIQV